MSLGLLAACAHGPGSGAPPAWAGQIGVAEAQRDAAHPAIRRALTSPDPALRTAGLWALGRIEEVGTSTLAAPLLMDADPGVAAAAAFALGQINEPASQAALRAALAHTKAPRAALRALSRCGTASAAVDIAAMLGNPDPSVRGEAALSLGLLKKRLGDELDATSAGGLAAMVEDPSPEVRFGAVYALARFAGPEAAHRLVLALADKDPEIRMWAVIGLGKSAANPQALDAVMRDEDWRVRAAAAAALGDMAEANPADASRAIGRLDALAQVAFGRVAKGDALERGRAMHVLLAAVEGARRTGDAGRRVLTRLEQATWETKNLPPKASRDIGRLQCAVAAALDRAAGVAKKIETCAKEAFPSWRRRAMWLDLRAAQGGPNAATAIAPYTRDPDAKVRAAAVLALGAVKDAASTAVLVELLASNDPYVASAAAETLARPDRSELRPPALAERLFDVLQRLLAQPDDSVIVGVIDAFGNLGPEARPMLGRLQALSKDPRPAVRRRAARVREKLTQKAVQIGPTVTARAAQVPSPHRSPLELVLMTERGEIVVRLDGEVAPRFTGVLAALAKRGFYNGLTVHRVVSNFVTQGGCPRGDGWGGPGYTVLAETSPQRFERGAVGMATNGRDTGGSQFFFMHAYHPHLDGNYPWVGRIVSGIDVMDALHVDDVIVSATVRAPELPLP